ncbi:MAG: Rid family hydrolase [Pseudomonadota bacterium]
MIISSAVLAGAIAAGSAAAETGATVVERPNGTRAVVAANEGARAFHDRWGYSPAVEAGGLILMAGAIAGPAPDDGTDVEAFKRSLRRTFASFEESLEALGATFADVARINTYHVWDSAYFDGDKMAHMEAVRAVKQEFMGAAKPAWTAIGVSELFTDSGLVEIELTVLAPKRDAADR